MARKLNQILAVERNVKSKNETEFTRFLQAAASPEKVNGFHKQYQPKLEDGEKFPPETKKVQVRVEEAIKRVGQLLGEMFDVEAVKDWANCNARADVVVDGHKLLENVPATYLLYLEKKLTGVSDFVGKLQTLDPSETWTKDGSLNLFVTSPAQTYKTKKVEKSEVVVQATDKFPAQVKDRVEDVIVGTWNMVKQSGAIEQERVDVIKERVQKLQRAVKMAREQANLVEATDQNVGKPIFDYLFAQ